MLSVELQSNPFSLYSDLPSYLKRDIKDAGSVFEKKKLAAR